MHQDLVIFLTLPSIAAVFNDECDIATYTIRTVDDPTTLNKTLYIKPPKNIYSFNEIASLWETKIGKTLHKVYLPEHQLLQQIAGIHVIDSVRP